jgi:hypothetical protein
MQSRPSIYVNYFGSLWVRTVKIRRPEDRQCCSTLTNCLLSGILCATDMSLHSGTESAEEVGRIAAMLATLDSFIPRGFYSEGHHIEWYTPTAKFLSLLKNKFQ